MQPFDPTAPTKVSKRAWARYSAQRPLPRRLCCADTSENLDAWILDLCAGGVGLVLGEAMAAGTLLLLELETCPLAPPVETLATVLYCQPTGDGEFRVGCRFIAPLTPDQVEILLQ